MEFNLNTARNPSGAFRHPYGGERPSLPPRKLSMFTDENDGEQGRVIDDYQLRDPHIVQAERMFEYLVIQRTSGPETTRPPLFTPDLFCVLHLGDDLKYGQVKQVYTVGNQWRYLLALSDTPGAQVSVTQSQMVALRPRRLYTGYDTQPTDYEWGAAEYMPVETKDRSEAA